MTRREEKDEVLFDRAAAKRAGVHDTMVYLTMDGLATREVQIGLRALT